MDEFEEAWKENRHVWESTKNLAKAMYLAGQQSRRAEIDQLKSLLEKDEYAHNLYYENLNLQTSIDEKDERIEELEMWIKGQIETLKCASKSRVYTEREQNLMLSQADDLEKALRGKDQYTEHRSKA